MYNSPITITSPITIADEITKKLLGEEEDTIVSYIQTLDIRVDKDELVKALRYDRDQYNKGYADALEDVIKHGEWEITEAWPHNVYCSRCHTRYAQTHWPVWRDGSLPRDFCPSCGAKMKIEGIKEWNNEL